MTARGEVVQQVATAYLHAIAASSEVDNAKALVDEAQVQLDHAHAAHVAGSGGKPRRTAGTGAVAGSAAGTDLRAERTAKRT